MVKRSTILFLIIAIFFGIATYSVKQSVMMIEQDLILSQKEIFRLEESIHILKAEWSSLTEPARLQKLVENHLNTEPMKHVQLASLDKVPSRPHETPIFKEGVTLASAKIP